MAVKKKATETIRVQLQSLARTVSERFKTNLHWAKGLCATDGNVIYLDPYSSFTESLSSGEWLVALKAVTCHESWHVKWTAMEPYLDFQKKNSDLPIKVVQCICNGLEDGRIEKAGVNDRPGTLMWIKFLNEKCWELNEPFGHPIADLCLSFISRCVSGKDIKGLTDNKVFELLDKVQPDIDKGRAASTTYECMIYAQKILDEFRPYVEAHLPKPEDMPGKTALGGRSETVPEGNVPEKAPTGEKEPFRKPIPKPIPKMKSKLPKSKEEVMEDSKENVSSNEDTGTKESDRVESKGTAESSEGEKEHSESSEASSKADTSEDVEASNGEKSEDDSSEGNGEYNSESKEEDGGSDPEEDTSELDDTEIISSSDSSESGDFYAEGECPETSELEELEESEPEEDCNTSVSDDTEVDTEAEPVSESVMLDELPGELEVSGDVRFEEAFTDSDETNMEGCVRVGEADSTEQDLIEEGGSLCAEAYDDEGFSELIEEADEEVAYLISEQEKLERKSSAEDKEVDVEELVRSMKMPELHKGVEFRTESWTRSRANFDKDMISTKHIRTQLLNELRPLLKRRQDEALPGRKSGRVDAGKLWRLPALLDTGVFYKPRKPSNKVDMVFYLLVDCSGSMYEDRRDIVARKAATIFASVLQELQIPVAVTGFTVEYQGIKQEVVHIPMVKFGEVDIVGVSAIRHGSDNRDGYSIRVAVEELKQRSETVKTLLVFSDGEPAARGYDGDYANSPGTIDTAKAVRKAEKDGVNVIGMYFGPTTGRNIEVERAIFKNIIILSNLTYLAGQTARFLKKLIKKYMVA